MTNKPCVKCGEIMTVENGLFTCQKCLREIVEFKRQQWAASSAETTKIIECNYCQVQGVPFEIVYQNGEAKNICDKCGQTINIVNGIVFGKKDNNVSD